VKPDAINSCTVAATVTVTVTVTVTFDVLAVIPAIR
jgi:hypothetical protein